MEQKKYQSFLDESIRNIKTFYENEQLVLFLGAGISLNSNLPNWTELIDSLKNDLNTDEDDFLKIAQMYYIQFGENIYYKKLLDMFALESKKPNELINKLVKLNCKYIVTTNWDDLIEKSIIKNGMFYDIVKTDDDFSILGVNTNVLIKIHGDLTNRDIVFKEDDYLNYADNHPLMENFIKSLFIRNAFLFIGYSLSDFNIKQIISWVQNKRSRNLPIYFIEINKTFNYLEFEYFKSKNIYVLYLNSFFDTNLSETHNIIKFINRFSSCNGIDFENSEDFLFNLYEVLKPFEEFNFVSGYELVNFLRNKFSLFGINEILFLCWGKPYIYIQNKTIINLIRQINLLMIRHNNNLINCVRYIYKIFRKSLISGVSEFGNQFNNLPLIRINCRLIIDDEFLIFDLKKIRNQILFQDDLLKRAFYYYKLERYYEAYQMLEQHSIDVFRKRNFVKYFISEFNKRKVLNILRNKSFMLDEKQAKKITQIYYENRKTDLFDLYLQLPKPYREPLKFMLDLDKFIEQKLLHANYQKEDTKDKGTNRLDYFANELYYFILDLILYVNQNFLMVDEFLKKVYQNTFEAILYEFKYKKIKFINYIFVYCGIIGAKNWKDINQFISNLGIELKLSNTGEKLDDIFLNVLENLFDEYLNETSLNSKYASYFRNYLAILANSSLKEKEINAIAEKLIKILRQKNMTLPDYELIDLFITKFNKLINPKKLKDILETFLDKFLCGNINFYDTQAIGRSISFNNIFEILKENNISIETPKIKRFLQLIDNFDVETKFFIYSYFITGIYTVTDDKNIIKEYLCDFADILKNLRNEKIESNVIKGLDYKIDKSYLYYEYLLILKIYNIELKIDFENELKKYILNYEGFCSCFVDIYNYIKILQNKLHNDNYLSDIEAILKQKIDEYKDKISNR